MIGGVVSGFLGIAICAVCPRNGSIVLPFYVLTQIGSSLSLYITPAMLAFGVPAVILLLSALFFSMNKVEKTL